MRLNRIAAVTAAASALLLLGVQARSADTPAPPAPAKGNCHLAGHVNGPDGKSAAGVMLKLVSKTPVKTADKTADAPAPKKPKGQAGITATTDADGNFKIDDVAAGQYQLTATLKGVGRQVQQINLTDGQTLDNIKMQLIKKKTA